MIFVSIIFSSNTYAFAQAKVDYSLVTKNCDINRIFEVDVVAEGEASLAAADIIVTYDSEDIDFRSVKTADSEIKMEKVEGDNSISSIILYSYGYKFSGKAKLMTFKFKALRSGNTEINLFVNDVVNKDCKSIPIGNVYSSNITISGDGGVVGKDVKSSNKINSKEIQESKPEIKKEKVKESTTKMKKEIVAEEYEDTNSQGFSEINSAAEDYYQYIIGGMAVLVLVTIVFTFYKIGKTKGKGDDKSDK